MYYNELFHAAIFIFHLCFVSAEEKVLTRIRSFRTDYVKLRNPKTKSGQGTRSLTSKQRWKLRRFAFLEPHSNITSGQNMGVVSNCNVGGKKCECRLCIQYFKSICINGYIHSISLCLVYMYYEVDPCLPPSFPFSYLSTSNTIQCFSLARLSQMTTTTTRRTERAPGAAAASQPRGCLCSLCLPTPRVRHASSSPPRCLLPRTLC